MNTEILVAGFGGQGILFAGKVLAYCGLLLDKEVSWLPSYGPEMRGGTANCSVCISDEPIGSPLVTEPEVLMVMNAPSYHKFIAHIKPHGLTLIDSTLITDKPVRTDIATIIIPATAIAAENGLDGMGNIVLVGAYLGKIKTVSLDTIKKAIEHCIPPQRRALIDKNMRAIELGMASV